MLQPLGVSADAEAAYVALAPLPSASVDELSKVTGTTPDEVRDTLEELRRLGLATEASTNWRAVPLLEVTKHLKAQRLSEIEMASVAPAPESPRSAISPQAKRAYSTGPQSVPRSA